MKASDEDTLPATAAVVTGPASSHRSDTISPPAQEPEYGLTPFVARFVTHFGEMGSRWGINRTVGQIYAYIFVSPQPVHAEDIAQTLGFSRSNVSVALRELQSWGLVSLRHTPGDRRDHFAPIGDAWTTFLQLAQERRRREVDPTLSMLRDALMQRVDGTADSHAQERMSDMLEVIEQITSWFDEMQSMDQQTLSRLMKMGTAVRKALDFTQKLLPGDRRSQAE
ncbi:GbsR/MarR family transcriptional regulator [Amphibiibacter pelophylacis]|uniref:GbsR/MarR family transcriptional regulator n=1 Tax=Amphibiibacter pelophylacis TaxID=1799477 RepID=A0ACC6P174_9BURK